MTCAIVLAAGKGTRMRTRTAKAAHRIAGRAMIAHVHAALSSLDDLEPVYVLGHLHEVVRGLLPDDVRIVVQEQQLGTGHAVQLAMAAVPADAGDVLVLYGDMPLITPETLGALRARHIGGGSRLTLLSAIVTSPFGYGRIVRDVDGRAMAVTEEKELADEQRAINEINTGVYAIDAAWLRSAVRSLPEHGDGEYYLTDLVALAASDGGLDVLPDGTPEETLGINDRQQLAQAEHLMRGRINRRLMEGGVSFIQPDSAYVAADATIGLDTVIEPDVWIGEGVTIGEGCHIGSGSRIVASSIGDRCSVLASVVEFAQIDDDVSVGPFSHLRVGTTVNAGARVGNFAEIKNSVLGAGSRMAHFSYLGDAGVGRDVNIGAGAVTVNFDGRGKHRTTIDDSAFIGSGTMLRAPVHVGRGSVTGAGSVVTHDVEDGDIVAGVPARVLKNTIDRGADSEVDR